MTVYTSMCLFYIFIVFANITGPLQRVLGWGPGPKKGGIPVFYVVVYYEIILIKVHYH